MIHLIKSVLNVPQVVYTILPHPNANPIRLLQLLSVLKVPLMILFLRHAFVQLHHLMITEPYVSLVMPHSFGTQPPKDVVNVEMVKPTMQHRGYAFNAQKALQLKPMEFVILAQLTPTSLLTPELVSHVQPVQFIIRPQKLVQVQSHPLNALPELLIQFRLTDVFALLTHPSIMVSNVQVALLDNIGIITPILVRSVLMVLSMMLPQEVA